MENITTEKRFEMFCPQCDEVLARNRSICSCGKWVYGDMLNNKNIEEKKSKQK